MSVDATVVSYQEFINAAADLYAAGCNAIVVQGPPGCGKTASAPYLQKKLGLAYRFMIKPGHHDVLDFQGLPVPDHNIKRTFFYPSGDLLPADDLKGGVLMVWDEGPDAPIPIQNLMCQALLEGGLHGYTFPENTKHLITGNRVFDRAGAQRLVTKLANRAGMFTLVPHIEELVMHGMASGWNPAVLAFLKLVGGDPVNPNDRAKDGRSVPTFFNSFDPNDPQQSLVPAFSSSRSWEFTSDLMNYMDKFNPGIGDAALVTRAAAFLGTPVASKFVPFRADAIHMPNPDDILAGKKVAFPTKQSVLWTLTITLVTRVKKDTWKHMDAWLQKSPAKEFRMLAIRLAFDSKAKELIGPDFNTTLQEAEVQQALKAK